MNETPTSLKVLGILGIIYSAFIILATPCGLYFTINPMAHDAMTDELRKDGLYMGYTLASGVLGFFLGVLLLASSIGCLKVKPWARMGMNTYAITTTLMTIISTFFSIFVIMPKMNAAFAAAPPGPVPASTMETMTIVITILSLLFVLAVVTTILVIVNRKIAVDAFHGIFPANPTNFPMDNPAPPMA